jgi:hypothetical protein
MWKAHFSNERLENLSEFLWQQFEHLSEEETTWDKISHSATF